MESQLLPSSKIQSAFQYVHTRALCAVCGAPAIGRNFDAMTCLSCKAFFRRNAYNEHLTFTCRLSSSCEINLSTRRHCSACRLKKCFQQGMKKELIRSLTAITHASSVSFQNFSHRQPIRRTVNCSTTNDQCNLSNDDWNLLTNIRQTYEEYCIKKFHESHQFIPLIPPKQPYRSRIKLQRLTDLQYKYMSVLTSFIKRIIQLNIYSDSTDEQYVYIQRNFSCLLPINTSELMKSKTLEYFPWENDRLLFEYVFPEHILVNHEKLIMNFQTFLPYDPFILKLCLIIFALSSRTCPLKRQFTYETNDFCSLPKHLLNSQNFYVNLLWKYVNYRFGYSEAIQFLVRFVQSFLHLQTVESEFDDIIEYREDLIQIFRQVRWNF